MSSGPGSPAPMDQPAARVQIRKRHLLSLEGLGAVLRRELGPRLGRAWTSPKVRRLSFAALAGAIVLVLLAMLAEAHLSSLARSEKPWLLLPHQGKANPRTVSTVRTLVPALGYVQWPSKKEGAFPRLNSWGFHDDEFVIPKPRDVARIVVIGDSMTYGRAAGKPSRTFSGVLEWKLGEMAPSDVRFDVANLALEGFQALQNDAMERHVALPLLEPDLVIYAFYGNDFSDTSIDFHRYRGRYPDVCPYPIVPELTEMIRPTPVDRLHFWVKEHSSLAADLRYRRAVLRYQVVLPMLDRLEAWGSGGWFGAALHGLRSLSSFTQACVEVDDGTAYVGLVVRDMKDTAEQAGVAFALLRIPNLQELGPRTDAEEDLYLESVAERNPGLHYIDARPPLLSRLARDGVDWRQLCASDRDCHPSVLGHDFLAEALFDGLTREGLIDELVARVRKRGAA